MHLSVNERQAYPHIAVSMHAFAGDGVEDEGLVGTTTHSFVILEPRPVSLLIYVRQSKISYLANPKCLGNKFKELSTKCLPLHAHKE